MLGLTHGRAQVQLVEIGAKRDGTIVGLRADLIADMGAYPIGAFLPTTTQEMLSGVYTIRDVACRGRSVVTNATPVAPYRGAGRPEATALIERAIDLVAAELGMDPVVVRRRNMIPPDAFPYETPSGTVYDIGDYERSWTSRWNWRTSTNSGPSRPPAGPGAITPSSASACARTSRSRRS